MTRYADWRTVMPPCLSSTAQTNSNKLEANIKLYARTNRPTFRARSNAPVTARTVPDHSRPRESTSAVPNGSGRQPLATEQALGFLRGDAPHRLAQTVKPAVDDVDLAPVMRSEAAYSI